MRFETFKIPKETIRKFDNRVFEIITMLQLKFFELHSIKISWGLLNAKPNFHQEKKVQLIKFFLVEIERWKKVVIIKAIDNVIKS